MHPTAASLRTEGGRIVGIETPRIEFIACLISGAAAARRTGGRWS